jgi:hypothetical protein
MTGGMTQMVKDLPHKLKTLSSNPNTVKICIFFIDNVIIYFNNHINH